MARHRKRTNSKLGRNSAIALTGLAPLGLIAVSHSAGASTDIPSLAASHSPESADTAAATETLDPMAPAPVTDTADSAPVIDTADLAPAEAPAPTTPQLPSSIAQGVLGVPGINLAAYQAADKTLAVEMPGCQMPWTLIAGIGRVESTHANDGKAEDQGNLTTPIFGPVLDGSLGGNNVITDTDGGTLDGNSSYDRGVGPMQFLPETWNRYGADGNSDGTADPQNLFDAALATGKYLCDGNLDMADIAQETTAILRYNNSLAYVANVTAWSVGYSTGIVPESDTLQRIH